MRGRNFSLGAGFLSHPGAEIRGLQNVGGRICQVLHIGQGAGFFNYVSPGGGTCQVPNAF